ncbi:unnamed protein product [Adineta ricciae]|uniref:Uncharacterized protein n=1 Tax=Adineta ricciae TaxID=249248 RepID=A0A815NFX7_ADIRI|nr:unnamed protein product [Adineta ricciae]
MDSRSGCSTIDLSTLKYASTVNIIILSVVFLVALTFFIVILIFVKRYATREEVVIIVPIVKLIPTTGHVSTTLK